MHQAFLGPLHVLFPLFSPFSLLLPPPLLFNYHWTFRCPCRDQFFLDLLTNGFFVFFSLPDLIKSFQSSTLSQSLFHCILIICLHNYSSLYHQLHEHDFMHFAYHHIHQNYAQLTFLQWMCIYFYFNCFN